MKLPVAVLISGRGSNLQSLIDAANHGELPAEIRVVISNRPGAAGLSRAARAGVPTRIVDHTDYPDRETFDTALAETIDASGAELVLLAGFMRVLSSQFIHHYAGRILNIHPSLLPSYPGLRTHERVLAAGETRHGASVHFVTEQLDGGPVILQASLPVHGDDDPQRLAARVLEQEHRIYPLAVRWYAEGRIRLGDEGVVMDGKPIDGPVLLTPQEHAPS